MIFILLMENISDKFVKQKLLLFKKQQNDSINDKRSRLLNDGRELFVLYKRTNLIEKK